MLRAPESLVNEFYCFLISSDMLSLGLKPFFLIESSVKSTDLREGLHLNREFILSTLFSKLGLSLEVR